LAFPKQIWIGCIGLSASWRQSWRCALLNVIEDLADELWIGDIGNDTKLSTTEGAECYVDSEHTLQWSVTRCCAQVSGAMGVSMLSVGGCAGLF
jgi:hypothetical protein